MKKFLKHKAAVMSFIFLGLVFALTLLVPALSPYTYDEQNISLGLSSPSLSHWMGTDSLGRDLFTRIFYGARLSLAVGILSALFAMLLGTVTGIISGYRGGWWDVILMRVVDYFYIFPSLLLAILLMLILGRGFLGIFIALGITAWVYQARIVRGQVLQIKEMNFIESARSLGATHLQIIFKHILPNLIGPILISLTIQVPTNILSESFLSFIGLGLQPPFSSWGTLANEGFRAMRTYPHLIIFPGGILFLSMISFNYLGDGLKDWLDPKSLTQPELQ